MSEKILFAEAFSDWSDINYVLVSFTKDYVDYVLGRMKLAANLKADNGNFYALEYFDSCTPRWYKYITESDRLSDWDEVECLPHMEPERTATNTIVITDDTVQWSAHPKHADEVTVWTPILTIEQLRKLF